MITLEKLDIYLKYKGDIDWFGRSTEDRDRELMPDSDWYVIELLLQDATVINRNLGSRNRMEEANKRLRDNTENEEVIVEIKRLAEKL